MVYQEIRPYRPNAPDLTNLSAHATLTDRVNECLLDPHQRGNIR